MDFGSSILTGACWKDRLNNYNIIIYINDWCFLIILYLIVSILDGNDKLIMGENMESREDWRETNTCSLSLVKTIQGLGIQWKVAHTPMKHGASQAALSRLGVKQHKI